MSTILISIKQNMLKKYKCLNCKNKFNEVDITLDDYPFEIRCPKCGSKNYEKNDIEIKEQNNENI